MRIILVLAALFIYGIADADVADGEALSNDLCYDCHYVDEGEMAELDATFESIKGIVEGTVNHRKKLKLTDEEISALVEYFDSIK